MSKGISTDQALIIKFLLEHDFRNVLQIASICEEEEVDAAFFFSKRLTEIDFVEIGFNVSDSKRLVRTIDSLGKTLV